MVSFPIYLGYDSDTKSPFCKSSILCHFEENFLSKSSQSFLYSPLREKHLLFLD